jgi:CubicO group peptidase (beta-lactamase class C family)
MKMKSLVCLLSLILVCPGLTAHAEGSKSPTGLDEKNIEQKIDKIADKYIGKDLPGVTIAVVKDGKVILNKGYGYANIEKKIPMDGQKTVLEAGSVSKLFAWTAVMQLVEEGKLDLDEDIDNYLPKGLLKKKSFKKPITIKHLMSHTAGFEESVEKMMVFDTKDIEPLGKYLAEKDQPKQVNKPGEIMAYSNFSTDLAGYIVERVSGKSFNDYVTENIFKPLGMEHSTFKKDYTTNKYVMDNKAVGYVKGKKGFNADKPIYINDEPAGSLNSTTTDIAKFMIGHLDEESKLFKNKETWETMHSNLYSSHPLLSGNAYGFWEKKLGGKDIVEHSGNTPAFTAKLSLVPEEDFGVCILNNLGAEASGIYPDVMKALVGEYQAEKTVIKSNADHDKLVVGKYKSALGFFSNYLKAFELLGDTNFSVKAKEGGGISVSGMGMLKDEEYREIGNLCYEKVSREDNAMDKVGFDSNRVAFTLNEDGSVEKMSFGTIMDLVPADLKDQTEFCQILLLVAMLVLILNTIRYIGRSIINKVKKRAKSDLNPLQKTNFAISAAGSIVIINILAVLISFASNPYLDSMKPMQMQLYINWILPVAIIAGLARFMKNISSLDFTRNQKIENGILIVVSIVFCIVLFNWHLL